MVEKIVTVVPVFRDDLVATANKLIYIEKLLRENRLIDAHEQCRILRQSVNRWIPRELPQ